MATTATQQQFSKRAKPYDENTIVAACAKLSLQNQKDCPLLRLPGELRNHIYGYVFEVERVRLCQNADSCRACARDLKQDPSTDKYNVGPHILYPRQHLNLLETCRQIHAEANLLPFTLNTFAGRYERLTEVPELLKAEQMHAITAIQVYFGRTSLDLDLADNEYGVSMGLCWEDWKTLRVMGEMQALKTLVMLPVITRGRGYGFKKAEWEVRKDESMAEVARVLRYKTSRGAEINVSFLLE